MQIYGSKFPISIALEFQHFFKMSKIHGLGGQKLALKAPGNGQSVTYSKMLKLDKRESLDLKMSDLVKFSTFACLTCFLCYRSRSITLCLFLKLILV